MTMEDGKTLFGRHNGEVGRSPIMSGEKYMQELVRRAIWTANMAMYEIKINKNHMPDEAKDDVRKLLKGQEGQLEIPKGLATAFTNDNLLQRVLDPQRLQEIENVDELYDFALPHQEGRTRDPIDKITVHSVFTPRRQGNQERTTWYLTRTPKVEEIGN